MHFVMKGAFLLKIKVSPYHSHKISWDIATLVWREGAEAMANPPDFSQKWL